MKTGFAVRALGGPSLETVEDFSSSMATKIKDDLESRYKKALTSYRQARTALADLRQSIDHTASLPYPGDVFRQVFNGWLDRVIRAYEAEGRGISQASIERGELSETCSSVDYHQRAYPNLGCSGDSLTLDEAVEKLLASYDFERLTEELADLSGKLEDKGLAEAADKIANDLGLNADYGREHDPKKTARHWVFSRFLYPDGFGGYGYRTREDLFSLMQALEVAEHDAGLPGLGTAMREIVDVIGNARERLPSRTRVAEGKALEAVIYKEKVEFKVSHDTGDGLLAFVAMHTTKRLIDLQ